MRSLLLSAWCVFPLALFATSGGVRVEEIGLGGYYAAEPEPTRVRVHLTNPGATSQKIELQFRIIYPPLLSNNRVDTFSGSVELRAPQETTLDVPLLSSPNWQALLEVEAHDAAGGVMGRDVRFLDYPIKESLIAIVCDELAKCQAAQSEIQFSGSAEEQALRGKNFKFVSVVHYPPAVWWAYAVAQTVVVAAPVSKLSSEERTALEGYLRQGGRLALVEGEASDSSFLQPYRSGEPAGISQVVGRGKLYRVRSLGSHQLGGLFGGPALQMLSNSARSPFRADELSWARKRLATQFNFPRLGWLLLWLSVYILVVGPANYSLLRSLGHREWSWLTVPALSFVFAAGLYVSSAAKRPKDFGVDEVVAYWMDDRSPLAAAEVGVRVSSPRLAEVEFSLAGDNVFIGDPEEGVAIQFAPGLVSAGPTASGNFRVHLGPPQELELGLLQWSFRDLNFEGIRTMPGTVRFSSPGRLRNETGQSFREALYVDKEKVYFLGPLSSGAEIVAAGARQENLESQTGRNVGFFGYPIRLCELDETAWSRPVQEANVTATQNNLAEWQELPHRPFSLVELIRGWPRGAGRVFDNRRGIFFGLANGPIFDDGLRSLSPAKKNFAITIVSFGKP